MSEPAGARGPEATFTGRVLIVAGVVLAVVTAGADLLKRRVELGPVQMVGLGLAAATVLLGIAVLRLPIARRVAVKLWPFGADAPVRPREILAFGLWLGLVSGALEVGLLYGLLRAGWRWETLNPHAVWMVPLVDAVTQAALAIPLAFFSWRRLPHLGAPRFAGFVLLVLAVGAPLSLFNVELRWISVVILTLGMAFQLSRWIASRRAGTRVIVRRTAVPVAIILALVAVAPLAKRAWAEREAIADLPAAPAGGRNVLLIVLDTVRAQNLSLHGYARRTTPWLERLAERSTVFDRAYAPSSWTLPSHGSFFTGRPPHQQSGNTLSPLDGVLPTLSGVLAGLGYYTFGIVANDANAYSHTGLDRGFLVYDEGTAALWEIAETSRIGELWRWGLRRVGIYLPTRKDADAVNERFLATLDRRGGRPFFAFLNYYDAHYPFDDPVPPAPGRERWPDVSIEVATVTQSWVPRTIDEYDREIAHLDERLESLFSILERRGLLEDTIVIVTSDHGDEFTEHGMLGHGYNVYNTTLHVPLIISQPGLVPEGLRVSNPVGLQDLPATIMELAGMAEKSPFAGRNLLAAASESPESVAPVLSELSLHPTGRQPLWNFRSLVWRDLHYIVNPNATEELYDLRADPWEMRNLNADGSDARLNRFRSALSSLIEEPALSRGAPQGE